MKEYKRRRPKLDKPRPATVYCPPTESTRRLDGSDCPQNCPMKGTPGCPLKGG